MSLCALILTKLFTTVNGTVPHNLLVWRRLHLFKILAQSLNVRRAIVKIGSTKDVASEEMIVTSTTEMNAKVLAMDVVEDADADAVVDVAVVMLVVDPSKGQIRRENLGRHL